METNLEGRPTAQQLLTSTLEKREIRLSLVKDKKIRFANRIKHSVESLQNKVLKSWQLQNSFYDLLSVPKFMSKNNFECVNLSNFFCTEIRVFLVMYLPSA